jgi:hypothetical protein
MIDSGNDVPLESQSSAQYDAWRDSVTKYLAQQSTTVSLADLLSHVPRPAGVHPSVSLVDVLITDPLQRFAISGEGESTRVRRIFRVDDDEIKDLVAKWRNSLANYLSNLTCTVGLSDIGSNVSRPYRLPSSVKLIDVLRTDPLNRFIITGEGNGIRAKFNFHLTEDQISCLVEQWRENISRFLSSQASSVGLSDIGSNVARPFCLPNSIKLLDTLQNDPVGRFAISGEGSTMRARRVYRPEDAEVFEACEDWRRSICHFVAMHPMHTTLSDIGFNVARPLHLPSSIKLLDVIKADPYQRFALEGEGNNMRTVLTAGGKTAAAAMLGNDDNMSDITAPSTGYGPGSDNYSSMLSNRPKYGGIPTGGHQPDYAYGAKRPYGVQADFGASGRGPAGMGAASPSYGGTMSGSGASVRTMGSSYDRDDNVDVAGFGNASVRSGSLGGMTRSNSIGSQGSHDSSTIQSNPPMPGAMWATAHSPPTVTPGAEWYPRGHPSAAQSGGRQPGYGQGPGQVQEPGQSDTHQMYQNIRFPQPSGPRGSGSLLSKQPAYSTSPPVPLHPQYGGGGGSGESFNRGYDPRAGNAPGYAGRSRQQQGSQQPGPGYTGFQSGHASQPPRGDQIPAEFLCPLSQQLMKDPVQAADGIIYDRRSIEHWMRTTNRSPITGRDFNSRKLIPSGYMRQAIESFTRRRPMSSPQPRGYGGYDQNPHYDPRYQGMDAPGTSYGSSDSGGSTSGYGPVDSLGSTVPYSLVNSAQPRNLTGTSPTSTSSVNSAMLPAPAPPSAKSTSPVVPQSQYGPVGSPKTGSAKLEGIPPGLSVPSVVSSLSFMDDSDEKSLGSHWNFEGMLGGSELDILGGSLNDLALGFASEKGPVPRSEKGTLYGSGVNAFVADNVSKKQDNIESVEGGFAQKQQSLDFGSVEDQPSATTEISANKLIPLSVWLPNLFAGFDGPLVSTFLESLRDECGFMTVQDLLQAQSNSQLTFEFMKSACGMKLGHFNRLIKGLESCKLK